MAHPGLLALFSQSESIDRSSRALTSGETPLLFLSPRGYAKTLALASLFYTLAKTFAVIVPTPEEAVVMARDLEDLLGGDSVVLFPAREVMPFSSQDKEESVWLRIACLSSLVRDSKPRIVVMPVIAVSRRIVSPDAFSKGLKVLKPQDSVPPEDLVRELVGKLGYERDYTVEQRGQVALRGGILDIFPPTSSYPIRIEFFGDQIESIRTFDLETQVSQDSVGEVIITPASDTVDSNEHGQRRVDQVPGSNPRITGTIFDYMPDSTQVIVDDWNRSLQALSEFEKMAVEIATARLAAGTMTPEESSIYFQASAITDFISSHLSLVFSQVPRSQKDLVFKDVIESSASIQVGFSGHWDDMAREIKNLISSDRSVVFLAGNEERRDVLARWLDREGIPTEKVDEIVRPPSRRVVTLSLGSGENGCNCEPLGLSLFTETEIYGRTKVRRERRRRASSHLDWHELSPGDYVVHLNHGIGRFMGIKTMVVDGAARDYIHIQYAGADALYVPVDQVDMLEKYVGPEGHVPTIQKLGTGDWQRIKARVQKSVKDMARKLIMLEAKRKSRKGHAFSPDTPWQRQFEEAFEYEDTPDQERATLEIKRDMEKDVPMDRLLCGDVGFGKTEVAMRCAFKAIMDSKQVAVLVPTTILAEQHFATFTRRFAGYPVNIQVLSRFRTPAQEKKILRDLATGALDIVIGTHRLLGKDVKFKDLGLLIIDEEHRFGVAQKERLKEIAETCDVLTLTATPIPRTLNMALSGVRDMSVIETPPEGRFPVETYVIPYNPSLVSWAIRREIRRGGQVFYVYNRVRSIGRALQRVQALVPEARIAVAHGQMNEGELSRVMQDFLQGRYDVLISTTIIESGLDLPNVNTLIVEDADKLGLAQLYQLRGRVGRSTRIAYAYFTFRPDKNLTVQAEERLDALRDFAAMGSGFKLAMRDMEIRGAGNLLGPEQHGFMALVGYDMYIRMLEKAVRSLKGEKEEQQQRISTSIEIPCDAYLPESYIHASKDRFLFYKRIAGAQDFETIDEIKEELRDRYGNLPPAVENLLKVAKLRIAAGNMGITAISMVKEDAVVKKSSLKLAIDVPHLFPTDKLAALPADLSRRVELNSRTSTLIYHLVDDSPEKALNDGLTLVTELSSR